MRRLWIAIVVALAMGCGACAVEGGSGGTAKQATALESPSTVSVKHPGGTTSVTLPARRVVSLHPFVNEALATLGVVPIAAERIASTDVVDGFVPLKDYQAGTGKASEGSLAAYIPQDAEAAWRSTTTDLPDGDPNVEAVLAQEPDLIFAHSLKVLELDLYQQLSSIAPTVLVDIEADPASLLRTVGAALGLSELAEGRCDGVRAAAGHRTGCPPARFAQETWAILRISDKELKVKGDHRSGRVLYNDLGLAPAAVVPIGKKDVKLSPEAIPTIDANHLILLTDPQSAAVFESVLANPVWATRPAVQKNQVNLVPRAYWEETSGVRSSTLLLEDLMAHFTDAMPAATTGPSSAPPTVEPAPSG